ncbi:MAG: ECF-type sigma factor [Holophagales bacterium]|nr:ECF-type sigma factor [Holophagales bacterium]
MQVTELLRDWSRSVDTALTEDPDAGARLYEALYARLHRLARGMLLSERAGHTLGPTALLHEAFLRLERLRGQAWTDRHHFLAAAARSMRRILVDHARRRNVAKRNGGQAAEPLDEAHVRAPRAGPELEALADALESLERVDPFKARLVDLRFFAGFSIAETARILGCGHTKVESHWRLAQGWLYRELVRRDRP